LTWGEEVKEDPTIKLSGDGRQPRAIDWKNSLAFCHAPSSNAIYVNKSHEAVQNWDAADYVEFCSKIRQQLLDFRNPDDGGQIFTSVELNKARIEGLPCHEHSPDIVVKIRDGGFVSVLKSPKVVFPREKPDGTHRPDGIFIARGPDIKVGQRIEPLSIVDITPLMLYLLGLPIPTDLEGRVPTEILIENALKGHSVEYQSVTQASFESSDKQDDISEEEKEALMEQLKLLGYMD
jgi:predicted AlkP superfamily phosphohydrolase/phosphomutase